MAYSTIPTQPILKPEKPSQHDQQVATSALKSLTDNNHSQLTGIVLEGSTEPLAVPAIALDPLVEVLKAIGAGANVVVTSVPDEISTQAAADHLGVSRPYLVKLLEEGYIPFVKVGRHRRLKFEDLLTYKRKMKAEQKEKLIELMRLDEANGMHDAE